MIQQQPERAQRIRNKKEHKMVHPNGLPNYYVGRPGQFGSPLKLVGDCIYIDATHRRQIMSPWIFVITGDAQVAQDLYRAMMTDSVDELDFKQHIQSMYDVNVWIKKMEGLDLELLRGSNLYCCCGLEEKCHADVLLELANK